MKLQTNPPNDFRLYCYLSEVSILIGIVILNYNTSNETVKCVESVKNFCDDYNIYIVDNNSLDNSYEFLSEYYKNNKNIKILYSKINGGYASGNNIGIEACIEDNIEYAIISNSDIIFTENSIEKLCDYIKNYSNTVVIGPQLMDSKMNVMSLPFTAHQTLLQYMRLKHNYNVLLSIEEANKYQKVYMVSGACFIINIQLFKNMGGFDEGTFLYNEEGIISMQAKIKKYDIFYAPEAKIIHNHGTSTGRSNLFVEGEILKSGIYYWKKYEHKSDLTILLLFIFVSLRTFIKMVTNRVSCSNFYDYLRNIFSELFKILKTKY